MSQRYPLPRAMRHRCPTCLRGLGVMREGVGRKGKEADHHTPTSITHSAIFTNLLSLSPYCFPNLFHSRTPCPPRCMLTRKTSPWFSLPCNHVFSEPARKRELKVDPRSSLTRRCLATCLPLRGHQGAAAGCGLLIGHGAVSITLSQQYSRCSGYW